MAMVKSVERLLRSFFRRAVFLGLLFFLLTSACNFPLLSQPHPTDEPSVQQTLAALWFATPVSSLQQGNNQSNPDIVTSLPAVSPGMIAYSIQSGDTLDALAKRFQVQPEEILSSSPLSAQGLLPSGQVVTIPAVIQEEVTGGALLPDSEVIFSPSAASLDLVAFIQSSGGYLSRYSLEIDGENLTGAQVVQRVALETSINPALLLGVLEYRSGWVTSNPPGADQTEYPIGFMLPSYAGLYKELLLTARYLTIGYYGWRSGNFIRLTFTDGSSLRIAPALNAGTVGLQSLFAMLYSQSGWQTALYGNASFPAAYRALFGDPWQRAALVEPLFSPALQPPSLELPFQPGERWALTGGPHAAWGIGSPFGALDFAPITGQKGCQVSTAWALASISGLVVRSADGVVVIDLDADGSEQTGWNLLYLHIAREGRISTGSRVQTGDRIGYPSCEGGVSSGTHVHLSRKYNGEWIPADGSLPLVLSGWRAFSEEKAYRGGLVKGDQVVTAKTDGSSNSVITR